MKTMVKSLLLVACCSSAAWADAPKPKNWTPPATKIYAQTLSDEIMAKHPELISVTFHGVPPGLDKVYTMFAGSFPTRLGGPLLDDDARSAEREQWDDADNFLAIAPGVVVGYDRNVVTNGMLTRHDIDVITKGITIVDPRWNKKDPVKKFVMMMPLRDAAGNHLGLLVLAYKYPPGRTKTETDFCLAATALRDDLQKKILNYAALFKPVTGSKEASAR